MKRYALAALVAATLITGLPHTAAAVTVNPNVTVLGDSITYLGADDLRRRGVDWEIEGAPGRPIGSLEWRLQVRLAEGPAPDVLVAALGTNATPGFTEAEYLRVLSMLPASTRIVLVTPYRNPAKWNRTNRPDYQWASYSEQYAEMMRRVAAIRPHTCIAPWRSFARHHRRLLVDGTHPNKVGQKAWAGIIVRAVHECE